MALPPGPELGLGILMKVVKTADRAPSGPRENVAPSMGVISDFQVPASRRLRSPLAERFLRVESPCCCGERSFGALWTLGRMAWQDSRGDGEFQGPDHVGHLREGVRLPHV